MKRSHQLIFLAILGLAVGTLLFGLLQFLGVKEDQPPPAPGITNTANGK